MEIFQKSNSVLWETGAYLAQLEKENEVIEKQLKGLLEPNLNEEETIKEYDLPDNENAPYTKSDKESLYHQQVVYLESKLEAVVEKVKSLESALKEKDSYILQLEKRQQRPQSPIREIMRDPPVVQTAFATNLKRREKELEKKLQECEKKMVEERKAMQRLQNLNKDLMNKVKEAQEREAEFKFKFDKVHVKEARANNLVEESHQLNIINHELHQRVDFLQEELNKMHANYNTLLATSIDFEEKSQELYHLNQNLNLKLQTLLKSNS